MTEIGSTFKISRDNDVSNKTYIPAAEVVLKVIERGNDNGNGRYFIWSLLQLKKPDHSQ
jgi:hypothetical protein